MSKRSGHGLIKDWKDEDDVSKLFTIVENRKKGNKEVKMERRKKN